MILAVFFCVPYFLNLFLVLVRVEMENDHPYQGVHSDQEAAQRDQEQKKILDGELSKVGYQWGYAGLGCGLALVAFDVARTRRKSKKITSAETEAA